MPGPYPCKKAEKNRKSNDERGGYKQRKQEA